MAMLHVKLQEIVLLSLSYSVIQGNRIKEVVRLQFRYSCNILEGIIVWTERVTNFTRIRSQLTEHEVVSAEHVRILSHYDVRLVRYDEAIDHRTEGGRELLRGRFNLQDLLIPFPLQTVQHLLIVVRKRAI